jgi:hypothetical protein
VNIPDQFRWVCVLRRTRSVQYERVETQQHNSQSASPEHSWRHLFLIS